MRSARPLRAWSWDAPSAHRPGRPGSTPGTFRRAAVGAGRDEPVDLPDLREDVEELFRDRLAAGRAGHSAGLLIGRGAEDGSHRRGRRSCAVPRSRRASMSARRGSRGASPMGMSMAAAARVPCVDLRHHSAEIGHDAHVDRGVLARGPR